MTGADPLPDLQAWLLLAIVLVLVASLGPGPASGVRYTLLAVLVYVLLTNAGRLGPAIARFNAGLPLGDDPTHRPPAPRPTY